LKDVLLLPGNISSIMIAHSLMLLLCCMQLKDVLSGKWQQPHYHDCS
jgi:hypothetical protein